MESDIANFLIKAKRETYANENAKKQASSRQGSSDYEYTDGIMAYHDTYFGGTKFMGEEIVYNSDATPIWGMNYYGVTLDESLSEEAVDKALRPALMQVGADSDILPVRGPKEYINGEYRYTFSVTGDLDSFEGVEIITKGDQEVYVLRCHGGTIQK